MADTALDGWRSKLSSADARARLEGRRELGNLLRSAYPKVPVGLEEVAWTRSGLAALGLTEVEVAAVTSETRLAARFRRDYDAEVAKLRRALKPIRMLSKPRIGPKMKAIADYVSAVPGQSISTVLRAAGISPRDRSSARAPIYRAEAAGLIIIERVRPNLARVFQNERARKIWYLRRELLAPGTPADRVEALRAEIESLVTEQAATWIGH